MDLYSMPIFRMKKSSISQDEWSTLNEISNTSGKIIKLNELLEIPIEDLNERCLICSQLHELLKKYYPDCLLLMHDSTVNGFGIKNCDTDLLFLPFPEYCNSDFVEDEKRNIPDPTSILTGEISKDVLLKFDEWSHLKFILKILRQDKSNIRRAYIQYKTPTLKLHLKANKIVCNLTSSNRVVVYRSELLQFFGKLDSRIKPLVRTLRLWARSLGLLKSGYISEYAFTLLIIFFLQNVNPPILPSVHYLCGISDKSRIVDGWETAFTSNVNLVNKSKNSATLGKLLIDFFEYYWNFDFAQNILCLNSGKTLAVKNLKNSNDVKMTNLKLSSINIQDPFVLSLNVCKFDDTTNIFKIVLLTACQILENIEAGKVTFQTLFNVNEYKKVLKLHYDRGLFEQPRSCFITLDFELANKSENWYVNVPKVLFDVLQYGLLIECEVIDKVLWGKKITVMHKSNGFNGNHDTKLDSLGLEKLSFKNNPYDLQLLISIQCILYSRTWIGRNTTTEITIDEEELKQFSNCSALKAEYGISRELVKRNPNLTSSVPLLIFRCDLYKHESSQITDLLVMLKPITYKREFLQVSAFLSSFIPKTVKKILACDN